MRALIIILISLLTSVQVYAEQKYFYCEIRSLDGTYLDVARWGKGTDFKYNSAKKRWEWESSYSDQYIYPDGRYVQYGKHVGFDDQKGHCGSSAEQKYKQNLEIIIRKYQ
ncbi:hypothetical protein ACMXYR_14945 [Neptuniibacter sp. QD29_5]|uniref:hypothetical protein n=1 Tax=Neptuniibacter sp. QD29_5 TaxID=3398207 RepID=UPI0039F464CF